MHKKMIIFVIIICTICKPQWKVPTFEKQIVCVCVWGGGGGGGGLISGCSKGIFTITNTDDMQND